MVDGFCAFAECETDEPCAFGWVAIKRAWGDGGDAGVLWEPSAEIYICFESEILGDLCVVGHDEVGALGEVDSEPEFVEGFAEQ